MKTKFQQLLKIRGVKLALEICLLVLVFTLLQSWMQRSMVEGTPPALQGRLLGGQTFNLQSVKGKPILINFWATWCGICKLEQNSIEAISKDYTVIGIAMNSGSSDDIRRYMKKYQLSFPVIVDEEGDIAQRYGVRAVPANFIINPEGQIAFKETGYTTAWGLRARLWLAGK